MPTHLALLEPERECSAAGSGAWKSAPGPVGIPRRLRDRSPLGSAAEAGPGLRALTAGGPASPTLRTSIRREICF